MTASSLTPDEEFALRRSLDMEAYVKATAKLELLLRTTAAMCIRLLGREEASKLVRQQVKNYQLDVASRYGLASNEQAQLTAMIDKQVKLLLEEFKL